MAFFYFQVKLKYSLLGIFLLVLATHTCQSSAVADTAEKSGFFIGDPRHCFSTTDTDKLTKGTHRFEVLPGGGWDNLRNKEAGMLVQMNYSQCKTTDDGRFLLPDSVFAVPLKSSRVETYAEMFSHWNNYTSTTSSSVNVEGGVSLAKFSISGKFSKEYQSVKEHQVNDNAMTTRVQLRYVRYSAKLQPDTPLAPAFRNRLLSVAGHIQLNRTEMARYESQVVVRDFGTHVITSVDAGAALVQEDHVKSSFVRSYSFEENSVLAAASASFFGFVHFGGSYSHKTSKTFIDQYQANRTDSKIKTYGGPVFKPVNYSANIWGDNLDNDLVAMDRSGDPIYFLVTPYQFPEVPSSTVFQLYDYLKTAVDRYYEFNTYRGCTKRDSPNFSFQANVDDNSCEAPETNFTFGGVYQKCDMRPGSNAGDLCSDLQQVNPLTGGYSCPNPEEYEAVLLHQGSRSHSSSTHSCHRCWLFFHCCDDDHFHSEATYSAYWCVARGAVQQQSGFMFGGVYTKTVGNPLTQSSSCPLYFHPLRIGTDLNVCVSDDYELGFQFSVPFAGLFSCKTGNPLMLNEKPTNQLLKTADGLTVHSLGAFIRSSGPSAWPHGCPKGYSQHLATIDQGCEISYCIKAHALSAMGLPPIRRPPFMEAPSNQYTDDYDMVMVGEFGRSWKWVNKTATGPGGNGQGQHESDTGLSGGSVAAISIMSTLVCIVVATIAVVTYRRHNRRRRALGRYREVPGTLETESVSTESPSRYGAVPDNEADPITVTTRT